MKEHRFVVCINNKGYEASLEFSKIYQVVVDKDAEAEGLIRIIDESGEDYGYSLERFHSVALPKTLERVLCVAWASKKSARDVYGIYEEPAF